MTKNRHRPKWGVNGGKGKPIPIEEAGKTFDGSKPRNRRERRAVIAWVRKNNKNKGA